ncbi:MAG: protoporphyrinogen oxidase [Bacteroidales bacterium]|nr:protoporphyrinogen oxidase [Bacteroidales bacterium]
MKTIEKDVVIIGAGLTGLTLAYYLKKAGKNVLVIEQSNRTGGVINSVTENGFTYETGPSTGVLGSLEIVELFEELRDKCELETAGKQAHKRYIWKKTKWEALPSGLISAVKTPLFTLADKFRILGEPFRKAGGYPDEPVAELVVRRLGKSFLDYAVDPFLSGVYAGDPNKLITRHTLPKLYALENNYGGFVRGTIAKHKGVKMQPHSHAHKITREVFSVRGGLKSLIDALTLEIGPDQLITSCRQTKINPTGKDYSTTFTDLSGEKYEIFSSKVVTTVGGYALPALLPFVDERLMEHLAETTYAPVIQVAVGYEKWTGIELDAFGGLVPSKEERKALGVLFPSAIFKGRSPENGALLSVFMGGINKPEILGMTDEEISQLVRDELRITMKVETEPDLLRIHRYKHAIAQYDIKTEKRLESIDKVERDFPGLILAGSFRDGIGMSDRVKQAKMLANQIL